MRPVGPPLPSPLSASDTSIQSVPPSPTCDYPHFQRSPTHDLLRPTVNLILNRPSCPHSASRLSPSRSRQQRYPRRGGRGKGQEARAREPRQGAGGRLAAAQALGRRGRAREARELAQGAQDRQGGELGHERHKREPVEEDCPARGGAGQRREEPEGDDRQVRACCCLYRPARV